MMASALATSLAGIRQVIIVSGDRADGDLGAVVAKSYLPFTLSLNLSSGSTGRAGRRCHLWPRCAPWAAQAAAYVCHEFTCRAPVTTEPELERALE